MASYHHKLKALIHFFFLEDLVLIESLFFFFFQVKLNSNQDGGWAWSMMNLLGKMMEGKSCQRFQISTWTKSKKKYW